jgi:hypothetical protein
MRPILVGHAVDLATAPLPPTTTAESKPTPPLAQRGLSSLDPPGSDEPVVDTAGEHADSGHPSHAAACPTAALHDLISVGHSGRGNARTPDAGHPDAQTPAPDSGHRSRGQTRVETGRPHRTLDAGRWPRMVDTLTKARPAPHLPRPRRPAAAHWATQRCSCGQRLQRLATLTARRWGHLPARDCLLPCRVAARSLRRLSRASAHCCPRTITGRA